MAHITQFHHETKRETLDRVLHVFGLLDRNRANQITREDVTSFVDEVGELISNIDRGLLTVQDFQLLKCNTINTLFIDGRKTLLNFMISCQSSGNDTKLFGKAVLTLDRFRQLAVYHYDLIACSLITDMVFGRFVRKLHKQLHIPLVFARSLAESALGNGRDISGKFPFIPEVLATAVDFLSSNDIRGYENPRKNLA
jgi:hypothetical protein